MPSQKRRRCYPPAIAPSSTGSGARGQRRDKTSAASLSSFRRLPNRRHRWSPKSNLSKSRWSNHPTSWGSASATTEQHSSRSPNSPPSSLTSGSTCATARRVPTARRPDPLSSDNARERSWLASGRRAISSKRRSRRSWRLLPRRGRRMLGGQEAGAAVESSRSTSNDSRLRASRSTSPAASLRPTDPSGPLSNCSDAPFGDKTRARTMTSQRRQSVGVLLKPHCSERPSRWVPKRYVNSRRAPGRPGSRAAHCSRFAGSSRCS